MDSEEEEEEFYMLRPFNKSEAELNKQSAKDDWRLRVDEHIASIGLASLA